MEGGALTSRRATFCSFSVHGLTDLHPEAVPAVLDQRLDICLLARLGGENEGRCERNVHLRKGRVWTLHRARPEPGNHGERLTGVLLQVRPFPDHRSVDLSFWVDVADAPLGFVARPFAVVADIFSQPCCALAVPRSAARNLGARLG